jgi:hypothetical protein
VGEKSIFAAYGGLAHLARALAWQARGDRFESGILHNVTKNPIAISGFFMDEY